MIDTRGYLNTSTFRYVYSVHKPTENLTYLKERLFIATDILGFTCGPRVF